jgi:hypothetical protein
LLALWALVPDKERPQALVEFYRTMNDPAQRRSMHGVCVDAWRNMVFNDVGLAGLPLWERYVAALPPGPDGKPDPRVENVTTTIISELKKRASQSEAKSSP